MTDRNSAAPAQTEPRPTPAQLVVTPIQGSPHSGTPVPGTVDSWGRTDGQQPLAPKRSRAGLFALLGLSTAALLGVAGFLGMRLQAAGAAASTGVELKPAPLPVIAVRPAPSDLDSIGAVSASPSATIAATPPPAPGLPEHMPTPKPRLAVTSTKPSPAPLASVRKAPDTNDLSDFGGRR